MEDTGFLADLKLRQDEKKADEILTGILNNGGQSGIYDNIHANLNEQNPDNSYVVSDETAQALLQKLIELKLADLTASEDDGEEQPSADTLYELGNFLGSLLTPEEIKDLYIQAMKGTDLSDDPFTDSNPRDFTVEIGERTEFSDTTIYNDGSITITQHNDDLTASTIRSERENVTIHVEKGSILADEKTDLHIYGAEMTLNVRDSIGTEAAPLVLEQTNNRPVLVPGIIELPYFDGAEKDNANDQSYAEKILAYEAGEMTLEELIDALVEDLEDKEYILRLVEIRKDQTEGATGPEAITEYQWILDVLVRHDWIREDFPEEATRLDAVAQTGSIFVKETTGDIGLGNVSAGKDVSISAPGSILDVRTEDEIGNREPNISAENAELTAENGTIGTEERPLLVELTGKENDFLANGDVDVDAIGNLTAEVDSITGKLDISAEEDLTITNTAVSDNGSGNMILDNLLAGGSISATAHGSILGQSEESSDKDVEAGYNVILNAGKNIGDQEDALRIDSAQSGYGDVTAFGKDITLQEADGDLTVEKIVGTGDVKLDAPNGGITDTTDSLLDEVAEAQRQADTLQNQATSAQAAADSQQLIADALKDKAEEAQARLEELSKLHTEIQKIQDQLNNSTLTDEEKAELQQQLKDMLNRQNQLEKTEAADKEAVKAYEDAQDLADKAQAEADLAQQKADEAQAEVAKVAKKNLEERKQAVADAKAELADAKQKLETEGPAKQAAAEEAAQQLPDAMKELEEVQNQIADLEQQLENEELSDEDRAALETQINDLKAEEADKKKTVDEIQSVIDAYEDLIHDAKVAEEELAEAEKKLEELQDLLHDMADAEQRAEDLRDTADDLQAKAKAKQEYADSLKPGAEEAAQQIPETEQELADVQTQIDALRDQLTDPGLTEEERAELQDQLEDLTQRKDELEAEKSDLEQVIDDYETAYDEYEAAKKEADEADRIADNAEEQIDHLHQTNDMAASEQIEADEYRKDAEEAQAEAKAKQEYANSLKPGAEEAAQQIPETEQELADVQTQIDALRNQLTDSDLTEREYNKLMDQLEDLKEQKKELQEALADQKQTVADAEQAKKEAYEAAERAEERKQQADAEQSQAEEAKKEDSPIYAGGDLNITAKDDIGEDDPLDITAGGETNVGSEDGNVSISNSAHMNLGNVTGENVELNSSGDLKPTDNDSGIHTGVQDDPTTPEDESKTETKAEINALGSSAGTDKRPLNVDADRISGTSGDDVNIHTPDDVIVDQVTPMAGSILTVFCKAILFSDDVIVDQLTAGGNLKLDADGDIIAGVQDEGAANVTGGSLDLSADGDIGSKDNYLIGDLDPKDNNDKGLLADADDIYLKLLGDVTIRDVNGDNVHIDADGRVDGADDNGNDPDVESNNLWISGNNGVGTKDNPLIIVVPGIVEIISKYGEVWFRNLYRYIEEIYCCCQCSFWDMVVARIMAAEEGETVEILETVPCDRMPEKVMKALRERSDVTLVLNLRGGTQLIIGAGNALEAPEKPGHHCYSMEWLYEHYMGKDI